MVIPSMRVIYGVSNVLIPARLGQDLTLNELSVIQPSSASPTHYVLINVNQEGPAAQLRLYLLLGINQRHCNDVDAPRRCCEE